MQSNPAFKKYHHGLPHLLEWRHQPYSRGNPGAARDIHAAGRDYHGAVGRTRQAAPLEVDYRTPWLPSSETGRQLQSDPRRARLASHSLAGPTRGVVSRARDTVHQTSHVGGRLRRRRARRWCRGRVPVTEAAGRRVGRRQRSKYGRAVHTRL